MKQLFYIAGFIILMIVTWKVMAKVKDIPEEEQKEIEEDIDKTEEDEEIEDNHVE